MKKTFFLLVLFFMTGVVLGFFAGSGYSKNRFKDIYFSESQLLGDIYILSLERIFNNEKTLKSLNPLFSEYLEALKPRRVDIYTAVFSLAEITSEGFAGDVHKTVLEYRTHNMNNYERLLNPESVKLKLDQKKLR